MAPEARDPRADTANEANLCAFLALQEGMTGAEVRHRADITWVANATPFFWFNMISGLRLAGGEVEPFVREVTATHRRLGTEVMLWLSPSSTPSALPERLEAAGVTRAGETPAMEADLDAVVGPAVPANVEIERVADHETLQQFVNTLLEGYEMNAFRDEWFEFYARAGLGPEAPVQSFQARLDGAPVSVATVYMAGGVAGIYAVATVPSARRRGIGAMVTKRALDEARDRGCRTGILQSSAMGLGVYAGMGFEETFRYQIHRWAPTGETA